MSKSEKIRQLGDEISDLKELVISQNTLQRAKDRLQAEYNASQSRFETVFEESPFGNKIINSDLRIIKVNKAFKRILGYTEEELLGNCIMDFVHPDFRSAWEKLRYELWTNERTSFDIDTCIIKKDKSSIWCQVTSILFLDGGEVLGYTIIEDISKRKELERIEEELQSTLLKLNQQVLEATIKSQEEERSRVAQALHNSLGQLLYAAKLSLVHLKPEKPLGHDSYQALEYTRTLLSRCISESRRISHELTPVILEDFGLSEAVKDISHQLRGAVKFKCEFVGFSDRLDNYLEISIYRMLQELMLNVVKHAGASEAFVRIEEQAETIIVTVEDNGQGFDVDRTRFGIGLQTIKSKVHLLKGRLEVLSIPGEKTSVSITIPITRS